MPEHLEHVVRDLVDGPPGIHHGEQSPRLVALLEGREIAAVCPEVVPDLRAILAPIKRTGIEVLLWPRRVVLEVVDQPGRPAVDPAAEDAIRELLLGRPLERDDPTETASLAPLKLDI